MAQRSARDAVLIRALILSAVLHLSTVTLFRIVIYFPREDIRYLDVSIVEARAASPAPPALRDPSFPAVRGLEQLDVSGPGFDAPESNDALPDIQLPTLAFDQLNLLRVRQEALETRSRYNEVFSGPRPDSWAGFGKRLDTVGQTLSDITFGSGQDKEPHPVSRPAPGFEAFIEWMNAPSDRQVLHVVPVDGLWGADPAELREPIALVFDVDADGNVTNVIDPIRVDSAYLDETVDALKQFRFAPILDAPDQTQRGTFILRPARVR